MSVIRKSVVDEIRDSGRYNDVRFVLNSILSDKDSSYPVDAYRGDDGMCSFRVDGESVRQEARDLIYSIDNNTINYCDFDMFENLYRYISSRLNTMLHNYANDVSHKITPKGDMECIRVYQIINNLLVCMDLIEEEGWDIPDGWKSVV